MKNRMHTINVLLMEDESTTSVVDFFKDESDVRVRLFDNLDDVWDVLKVCSGRSKGCMHYILFFNLKLVSDDIKQFVFRVKEDPVLKSAPVFILSESLDDGDVRDLYKIYLTNFIMKPDNLVDLGRVLGAFKTFWFDLAELP
jgi:hypothetical protein